MASEAIASGADVIQRIILPEEGWCSARYLIRQILLVELSQESIIEAVKLATLCYASQEPVLGSIIASKYEIQPNLSAVVR